MTSHLDSIIDQELELQFKDQFKPPDEEDDEVQKTSLRVWWSVILANKYRPYRERQQLYERALKCIPQCYKLWYNYLNDSVETFSNKSPLAKQYIEINEIFERSLQYMERMPKIWFMYVQHLKNQKLTGKIREIFDRAINHLPITQHEDMWTLYTEWALEQNSVETLFHVAKRYMLLDPDFKEEVAQYMVEREEYDKAAVIYYEMIKDDRFVSRKGATNFQLYLDLCDMIYQNPEKIKSIDCEKIIAEGISKYVDEVGNLWVRLANYHIKLGSFQKARDVFDEGVKKIQTARDFNIVYNAHLQFEQEMLNALYAEDDENLDEQLIEEQLDRLEQLADSRQMLLTNCLLKANKNSVQDWMKKLDLVEGDQEVLLETYIDAQNTIDPLEAVNGSYAQIYIKFAKFYYSHGRYKDFNIVLQKATQIHFRSVEDVLMVWIFWVETLLKDGFHSDAIRVIKQALFQRSANQAHSLYNNLKLWELYLDLEINFGTVQTIKAAYQKIMNLNQHKKSQIFTPIILMNQAEFLETNHFYEESFRVYEKGISMFQWPGLYHIWLTYLSKFIERYGNKKLERTRDLFEKVLSEVPEKFSKIFYLMYAEFEEKYGLLNHTFEIYDRMVANIPDTEKLNGYNIYISKIAQYLGVTKTRPIFQNAIESFQGQDLVGIGLRFAHLERKFGEIDRSRAIYTHISQFADPRDDDTGLWKIWKEFEVNHGNNETVVEMFRVKKSVLAKFNLMPADPKKIKEKVEAGII